MSTETFTSYDSVRLNPNLRDIGSPASDVVSAARGTTEAVVAGVGVNSVIAAGAIAGAKVAGGLWLTALGAHMVTDAASKTKEAYRVGHKEGGVRHALYGGMGASLVGLGGLSAASNAMEIANIAGAGVSIPAQLAVAIPGVIIGMYSIQAFYALRNMYITRNFQAELDKQKDPYAWLREQAGMDDKEGLERDKKRHDFELRTSAATLKMLEESTPGQAAEVVAKVKEACFKRQVTNWLLLVIAAIGIAIGVVSLLMPGGSALVALIAVGAILSLSWLSLDSSRVHIWIQDKLWEKFGKPNEIAESQKSSHCAQIDAHLLSSALNKPLSSDGILPPSNDPHR